MENQSIQIKSSQSVNQQNPKTHPDRRYEERYQASWAELSLNPAQLLEEEIRSWCEEVFEDVKPSFFGPMAAANVACRARLNYENLWVTWFTDPHGWNLAQRAVLQHALRHDPEKIATHTFRESEYWLKFHLNFGPKPSLKRFSGRTILPGSAILGSHGSAKTVTLCAPPCPAKQLGYVVKTSAYEDGLILENLALQQLVGKMNIPQELGMSLGKLNQGRLPSAKRQAALFENQNLQQLLAGYNLITIPRINNLLPLACTVLHQLVDHTSPPTSLAEQAELLRNEILCSGISQSLKDCLQELLQRVNDTTPVAPSRMHGDFRRGNLLAIPDGLDFAAKSFDFELAVIDWELSKASRLGILDFAQLILDLQQASLNRKSLDEMFAEGELEFFCEALKQSDLPGCSLPAGQILALHLATYAFDRAWGFGGRGESDGYEQALSGRWPFDRIEET